MTIESLDVSAADIKKRICDIVKADNLDVNSRVIDMIVAASEGSLRKAMIMLAEKAESR